MAAIWKGAISFGLVSIPVELRSAVRGDRISFRMLHAEDLSPVKYERVCTEDGEPVPWNEVVKGYEYAKRESLEQGKKQPSSGKRARSGTVRAPRKSAASRERTSPRSRRSA